MIREKLKCERLRRGLTQEEVGLLVGITKQAYSRIEIGQREGKGWLWDRLEDLFGVDQRELRKLDADSA